MPLHKKVFLIILFSKNFIQAWFWKYERKKHKVSRVLSAILERILLHKYPAAEKALSDSTLVGGIANKAL